MARSGFSRQDKQVRSSDVYDDTIAPSEANFETNPENLEEDLNSLRSQVSNLLDVQVGDWFDDLNTPSALEAGTQRGVNDLNTDLHAIEKKRFLQKNVSSQVDISVGASDNFAVLGVGELPSNTTIAVGAVTTLGTVAAAHGGTFGTHSLAEVAGPGATTPDNLVRVLDTVTGDEIPSGGKIVKALLQSENASDGHTATISTPNRLQVSFVRINSAGTDLEICPASDIQGRDVTLCFIERVRFEDLSEEAFVPTDVDSIPHKTLRQLIHLSGQALGEGFGTQLNIVATPPGSAFPTLYTCYTDGDTETAKLWTIAITYNVDNTLNTATFTLFDDDGTTAVSPTMLITMDYANFLTPTSKYTFPA